MRRPRNPLLGPPESKGGLGHCQGFLNYHGVSGPGNLRKEGSRDAVGQDAGETPMLEEILSRDDHQGRAPYPSQVPGQVDPQEGLAESRECLEVFRGRARMAPSRLSRASLLASMYSGE